MTPAQMRSFYNMPSSGGQGVIAVVDLYDYPTALADFNNFSATFGLPQETSSDVTSSSNQVFQVVYAEGTQPPTDPNATSTDAGWAVESAMDIEWAHAMAPSAKIVLVETGSDLLHGVDVAAGLPGVQQISMSWTQGARNSAGRVIEYATESNDDSHFQKNGVLFFASAGDTGAPAAWPSASPYVVSIGGTNVATDANGAFTGETGWSLDAFGQATGGGPSQFEPKPAYQQGIANTDANNRSTPDISADADPKSGAAVFAPLGAGQASGWKTVGGTSLASPCMAAMVNVRGTSFTNTQALLTYIYSRMGTSDVRDITSGYNGYAAGAGYDFVTGVGVPAGSLFGAAGSTSAPAITSPTAGSTLSGASVTFTWSAGTGVAQYWLQIGTSATPASLYNHDEGTSLQDTVTLPTDGRTINVRLWYRIGSTWKQAPDVACTAATVAVQTPVITAPAPGSTLSGSTVTLQWSAGSGVSEYWLRVLDATGRILYDRSQGTSLSLTLSGLPTDGSALTVRFWYFTDTWHQAADTHYTAATVAAQAPVITAPAPGSTLAGSTVTFQWSAGSGVSQYWLRVLDATGRILYDRSQGTSLSLTLSGLPTDGSALTVRFWYFTDTWHQAADTHYTAATETQNTVFPTIVSPADGSTLSGSSVTFQWTRGINVSEYWVEVFDAAGLEYNRSQGTNTSLTLTGIPTDGRALLVRLYYQIAGFWFSADFHYTAAQQ